MFVYFRFEESNNTHLKRNIGALRLVSRDEVRMPHFVQGIQAFVEPLLIPNSNTFLTVFLAFLVIAAFIIVLILLFKLIAEIFSLKSFEKFRKRHL